MCVFERAKTTNESGPYFLKLFIFNRLGSYGTFKLLGTFKIDFYLSLCYSTKQVAETGYNSLLRTNKSDRHGCFDAKLMFGNSGQRGQRVLW